MMAEQPYRQWQDVETNGAYFLRCWRETEQHKAEYLETGPLWPVIIVEGRKIIVREGARFLETDKGDLYSVAALVDAVSAEKYRYVPVLRAHPGEEIRRPGECGYIADAWWNPEKDRVEGVVSLYSKSLNESLLGIAARGNLADVGLSSLNKVMSRPRFKNKPGEIYDEILAVESVDFVDEPLFGGHFRQLSGPVSATAEPPPKPQIRPYSGPPITRMTTVKNLSYELAKWRQKNR